MRLDTYLFENGLAKSRSFAKTLIEDGYVTVNAKKIKKPAFDVTGADTVLVTGTPYSYVSRGGLKLEGALEGFGIDVTGMTAVDIGASSGGFTDCLLKRGALKVYAVDSGSGQLDAVLRADPRVVNIENFNARNMTCEDIGELCDIAVTDVSFISQTLIIPAVVRVLKKDGVYVSLIKPQFECGREVLGKGGIVRNKKIMADAVKKVIDCAENSGLACLDLMSSPIQGGDGNTEFLMYCVFGADRKVFENKIKEVVGI